MAGIRHARQLTCVQVWRALEGGGAPSWAAHPLRALSSSSSSSSAGPPSPAASSSAAPTGLAAVPPLPRFLGFAGAIPFLALAPPVATALPLLPAGLAAGAAPLQLGYGVAIAAFLGAQHWALAMAEYGGRTASAAAATERYVWGVTPSLLAWPAVSMEAGPGALVLAGVLTAAYAVDRSFAAKGLLPRWYMTLRLPLTLAAVTGLLTTVVHSLSQSRSALSRASETAKSIAEGPRTPH